jgi:branched-subunit amino acid transport protein
MAVTTYLIRALPLTLFKKPIRSRFLRSFLHYVPTACLTAMTFPAILSATDHMIRSQEHCPTQGVQCHAKSNQEIFFGSVKIRMF